MARGALGAPAAPVPSPRAREAGRRASPPRPSPRAPRSAHPERDGGGWGSVSGEVQGLLSPAPGQPGQTPDTHLREDSEPPRWAISAPTIARTEAEAGARQPAPGPRRARSGTMSRRWVGAWSRCPPRGPDAPAGPRSRPGRQPGLHRGTGRGETGRLRTRGPLHLRPPGPGGPTRTHLRGQPGPRAPELRRRREAAASPAAGGGCTGTRPGGARRPGP